MGAAMGTTRDLVNHGDYVLKELSNREILVFAMLFRFDGLSRRELATGVDDLGLKHSDPISNLMTEGQIAAALARLASKGLVHSFKKSSYLPIEIIREWHKNRDSTEYELTDVGWTIGEKFNTLMHQLDGIARLEFALRKPSQLAIAREAAKLIRASTMEPYRNLLAQRRAL